MDTGSVSIPRPQVPGAGHQGRDGLTKAAMAAPSLEVTAAKETTRKMMMALMQRRKSWGARGSGVWGSLPGGFPS